MGSSLIFFGIIIFILFIAWSMYARAISVKNKASEAESAIDVQLQKRRDLVPNVLKLAKKFMEHEASILGELTELRSSMAGLQSGVSAEAIKMDGAISGALGRFFAVAENYPDLKSDTTVVNAQDTFEEVEGHIAAARRFYNAAVLENNNMCETFPMSFFAGMVGAKELPFFEATAEAKKPIDVDDYM